MKKTTKNMLIFLGTITVISLTACSHENPLESHSQEEVLRFIRSSSSYAEKKMNYKSMGSGDAYLWCMRGDLDKEPTFCPDVYRYMVEYAKNSSSVFRSISVEDLKDKKFFSSVVEHSSYSFNAFPLA